MVRRREDDILESELRVGKNIEETRKFRAIQQTAYFWAARARVDQQNRLPDFVCETSCKSSAAKSTYF